MRDIINTKILLSASTLVVALAVVIGATYAFFSDTETSADNTFVSGAVDLKIDNTSFYNGVANAGTSWASKDLELEKFFDFQDVKPSDYGEDTISVLVETNDAWVCADVTLTSNDENELTVNEEDDGDSTSGVEGIGGGELANSINFLWWADDGDNVLEDDETPLPAGPIGALDVDETATVALADSISSIYPEGELNTGGAMLGNTTYYVGKAWCFGAISPAALPPAPYAGGPAADNDGDTEEGTPADGGFSCDASNENDVTQTDSLTADISFRAFQSRNNPSFTCEGGSTTPTPTPTPIIACTSVDNIFATTAHENDQGLRKDNTPVLANRSVASAAFGAPQSAGADSDVGVFTGQFFSLGFPLGGNTASIVYGFAEPFFNGPGDDLQIYEITGGVYPDEIVKVEVASSSTGPWTVVDPTAIRDELIDIDPVTSAQFVRLTDVSNINLFTGTGDATPDGYDLDAIRAICTEVTP